MEEVRVQRVYDASGHDGHDHRVLVDRLWPRGLKKADAELDEWLRDVAPSTELRRWYSHDVDRFAEFSRRYRRELREPPASTAVDHLIEVAETTPLTLLTATRDVDHSAAKVLHDRLSTLLRRS
jgi:uncharacterized protein YeaO (DUF488 family)